MSAEWVSAVTALVAVILGPFVGVYVARRQIQISTISTNRSEWIRQLRDLVAQLVTECRVYGIEFLAGETGMDKQRALDGVQRIFHLEQQIALMLNPNEAKHQALLGLMREAVTNIGNTDEERRTRVREHTSAVVKAAQSILKEEWDRLKAGK